MPGPGRRVDVATTSRIAHDLLDHDDWVLIERERHRQLRLHALEHLCARLSTEGHHAAATEPLRERAHRVPIGAHLAEGNPGDALRRYAICCRLLDRDLNIEPSPALQALMAPWPQSRRCPLRHGAVRPP